jgi:hypothetical protein
MHLNGVSRQGVRSHRPGIHVTHRRFVMGCGPSGRSAEGPRCNGSSVRPGAVSACWRSGLPARVAAALRRCRCQWSIEVVEADVDWDEPGEPKTDGRTVPIPPRLVELLRSWIDEHELAPDDLLFRTRNDRRPAPSNWSRSLNRAYREVGHPPLRVYDLRHAC